MNENWFGLIWLISGYVILIMVLGVIIPFLGQLKGIKTFPGFLGLFMVVIALVIFALLKNEGKDGRLVLFGICAVIPLIYLINLIIIVLRKKTVNNAAEFRKSALISLFVFGGTLLIWGTGVLITQPWQALNAFLLKGIGL